jgi:His-Xaa-Ser system protein HxsD
MGLTVVDVGEHVARFTVDVNVYTRDTLFRACYVFTDRCYLFLIDQPDHNVVVEFRKKEPSPGLGDLVGAFANELINQRVRADVARETGKIRELIVAQAFAEADFRESPP